MSDSPLPTHYWKQAIIAANKGGTMSGIIAVTNPSDESAEAGIVEEHNGITPRGILEEYGSRLEDGAQIVMTNGDNRVWQYIATREPGEFGSIALRSNNGLAEHPEDDRDLRFITFVAGGYEHGEHIIETGDYPLVTTPDPAELETFTVFGVDDDGHKFKAVVSATEDTVQTVGVEAGLVDEGFEDDVRIDLILKGDHSDLEPLTV